MDDGLQSEEYIGGAYYESRTGEMFFGGIEGVNSFFPKEVRANYYAPDIVITDLKIFNESVPVGRGFSLKKQIYNTEEIHLSHWQNDISFDFVALHFAKPSKKHYAFKLDNYDMHWRYVNHSRTATYTNLDAGEYVFRVKGSNNDGLWNQQGKTIRLVITPPWWRTSWAYVSYFVLLALFAFAIDRIQRGRLSSKETRKAELALLEAENKRKSQELEEARQLQLSMLPKTLPLLPHLVIAVYMKTATEVGGDYYDFHVSMDGTLTVVIGDATGHGMKAGTMVTAAKSLFSSCAPNPDILYSFKEISRCLKEMNFSRLSMCLSMLKIKGHQMQMASAGMPPVYIFRHETRMVEEHLFEGLPLGVMENFSYKVQGSKLHPGDTILLSSDGLPELRNSNDELFGYERIRDIFAEIGANSPDEIVNCLKTESAGWLSHNAPDDDITFVVLKMKN